LRGEKPSGLVLPAADKFTIFHSPPLPSLHGSVIVSHELAHILLGHTSTPCHEIDALLGVSRARGLFDDPEEKTAERLACEVV